MQGQSFKYSAKNRNSIKIENLGSSFIDKEIENICFTVNLGLSHQNNKNGRPLTHKPFNDQRPSHIETIQLICWTNQLNTKSIEWFLYKSNTGR